MMYTPAQILFQNNDHYLREKMNRKRCFQHPASFCYKAGWSDVALGVGTTLSQGT